MTRVITGCALVAVACAFSASVAAADPAAAVIGVWWTEEGDARVEIHQEGDEIKGRLVWIDEPVYPGGHAFAGQPKMDMENPDEALRSRRILGLEFLWGFKWDGKGEWKGGRIYDPESGKTYKAKFKLEDDVLKLRGYVGFSMIGRTTEWTRYVADDDTDAGVASGSAGDDTEDDEDEDDDDDE
jgi:uncharacterized protein (DUF2147 family)